MTRLFACFSLCLLMGLLGACQPKEQPVDVVSSFGTAGTGVGQFKYIEGIYITDDDRVLITDAANQKVIVYSTAGKYLMSFGYLESDHGEINGKINSPHLEKPEGITIHPETGDIYVADHLSGFIKRYAADYKWIATYSGYGTEEGQTRGNEFMTFHPNGLLYLAEASNNRISVFSAEGEFQFSFGEQGDGEGAFDRPVSVKHNSAGLLFVTDKNNDRVQVFDEKGEFQYEWGTSGEALGQMRKPAGLAIDAQDNVYIAEAGNNRIQKFTADGKALWVFGEVGQAIGQFGNPHDMAFDRQGLLYVTDTANGRVQVLKEK